MRKRELPQRGAAPVQSPFLLEQEAAEVLRLERGTLQNKRLRGDGPPFLKVGSRVLYDRQALVDWARARSRTSTSDAA